MSNVLETGKFLDNVGLSQLWGLILAGFVAQEAGKGLSTNDFTDELAQKLNDIAEGAQVNVIESVKVNGVALEVTEKGVNIQVPTGTLAALDKVSQEHLDEALFALIAGKADKANTLAGYGITDAYTQEQTNTAIDTAVRTAVASTYKVKGSITLAELPTVGMVTGDVYNIKEDFVTTDAFVEGAGLSYKAGTNVVYTETGWDCLAGTYDFSDFLRKDDIRSLTPEEIEEICQMPTV